jgi:hypothetical protein
VERIFWVEKLELPCIVNFGELEFYEGCVA